MNTALLLPVVFASVVGSLHCAGMCGGFVAFYSGGGSQRGFRDRTLPHLSYNLGRLITYTALGGVAGAIGSAVDLAGNAAGVARAGAFLAFSLMMVWGAVLLLQAGGVRIPQPGFVTGMSQRAVSSLRALKARPPVVRALLLGLSSTLLPCGWLYAFVVSAAGTGSALSGAVVMAAFWAGTLPMLLSLGVGLSAVLGRMRRHLPVLSAAMLLLVGVAGVLTRINMPKLAAESVGGAIGTSSSGAMVVHPPNCPYHGH